jgi:uncharacterized protein Usg
MVSEDFRK